MANIIQIKRSTTQVSPVSLEQGEMGYSELSGNLFIGTAGSGLDLIGGQTAMTKLDGIEDGATANETDAFLLDRANHTGLEQTTDIADAAITYPKMQTMAAGLVLLGNNTGAGSVVTELTVAQVLAMLDVESGADKTDADNVNAAGAVMNTDITTVEMQFVSNDPDLAANSPTILSTQQAIKAYVDNAVTGALEFQGGYDAATNVPDLDTNPIPGILLGYFWQVTVAGTFFSTPVAAGDNLVANIDSPIVEADWTIVSNQAQTASETQAGIVRLANQAETNDGVDNTIAVNPLRLNAWPGSDAITNVGIITDGTWNGDPIDASELPLASTTQLGIVQVATLAVVNAGLDALQTISPNTLANAILDGGTF
jgi:hypothetical protein